MLLTRAAEYAVRCVLYLSGQEFDRIVPKREVAETMGIPTAFLAKVAQSLAKAGIIQIRQGAKGGYRLAEKPGRIALLAVVEAIEGEILLNSCLAGPKSCRRRTGCKVHQIWAKARTRLRETLGEVNFEQLAREQFCRQTALEVVNDSNRGSAYFYR